MPKFKRMLITERVTIHPDFNGLPIRKAIQALDEIDQRFRDKGAIGDIRLIVDCYDDFVEYIAEWQRWETDKEYDTRITRQRQLLANREETERQTYERLKKKFEHVSAPVELP